MLPWSGIPGQLVDFLMEEARENGCFRSHTLLRAPRRTGPDEKLR